MTREEAIQRLIDLQDGSGQTYEAIRIAIEALSADTVSREFYEDAVKANHGLAKELANLKKEFESAEVEFTDLPDIPRYYYEKVVGNMAHEINMLKEQLESADAAQGEWKIDEYGIYHCPFCHAINNTVYKSFCPNCGSRMESEE